MNTRKNQNKLIAEYLDILVFVETNHGKTYFYYNNVENRDYEPLPNYDNDWNALMPVIEKINSVCGNIKITTDINEMYILVINFIDNR